MLQALLMPSYFADTLTCRHAAADTFAKIISRRRSLRAAVAAAANMLLSPAADATLPCRR